MTNPNLRNWLGHRPAEDPTPDPAPPPAPTENAAPETDDAHTHGRIVPDAELNAPVHTVKGVPPHVDENGDPVQNFHNVTKAPSTVKQNFPTPRPQVVTVGREEKYVPRPPASALKVDASRDPAAPAHTLTAARPADLSPHRVVQSPQNAVSSTVKVVDGPTSPSHAAHVLSQAVNPNGDPTVILVRPEGVPQSDGPQLSGPMPTGTEVVEENDQVRIIMADEETTRREAKLAGMRMPAKEAIPEMEVPVDPDAGPPLDVTVILTSHNKPHLLGAQIAALNAGKRRPRKIWILVIGDGPHDQNAIAPYHRNVYGIPPTPLDRFSMAMSAADPFVCILEEDCIPGSRWLEAAHDALEGDMRAVVACAGERFDRSMKRVAYRGPSTHASGSIVATDLGDEDRAAKVDQGEGGWFVRVSDMARCDFIAREMLGWKLQLGDMMRTNDPEIPTVVLPYTDMETWGATTPRPEPETPTEVNEVDRLHHFQAWMDDDMLVSDGDVLSLEVPLPPGSRPVVLGTYFNAKLGRDLTPDDPEWSIDHYELVTGETWHELSQSPLPPPAPMGKQPDDATKIPAHKDTSEDG